MKFDVLGLGESLSSYVNKGNQTIGVNDIWKRYPTDYLCVVDLIEKFTPDRFETIKNSKPKKFFCHLVEWHQHVSNFQQINLSPGRGLLTNLDSNLICYSNNSTYTACVLAFKLGAKELYLYGCDFNTHKNFKDKNLEKTLKDFKLLYKTFYNRGIRMYVTKESKLSQFIPVIK